MVRGLPEDMRSPASLGIGEEEYQLAEYLAEGAGCCADYACNRLRERAWGLAVQRGFLAAAAGQPPLHPTDWGESVAAAGESGGW